MTTSVLHLLHLDAISRTPRTVALVRSRWLSAVLWCALVSSSSVGTGLLLLNVAGFVVPLRSPEIDGYRDFGGAQTLPAADALARLDRLETTQLTAVELVTEATQLFHEGLAHVSPEDVEANGLAHYRMRVPPTENWVLFSLSFAKPDTYDDYEFCSHRRALERGTGRCGQSSLALVSFLSGRGMETGFISLKGKHVLATARVEDRWYLLDPDLGGVVPFDIVAARAKPESVLQHYWSPAAARNGLDRLIANESIVTRYGGPEARYGRACPIERVSYFLKWAVPMALGGVAFALYRAKR